MHVIYSDQSEGFEPGKVYSNARYFESIRRGATSITVIGDYPNVVAAAEALGIPCEVIRDTPDDASDEPTSGGADQSAAGNAGELTVAKGPRGAFYLMRDGQRASAGFKTEAEALAAMPANEGDPKQEPEIAVDPIEDNR
jgi:hypothetical protein